jgi:hypothetical protein
MAWTRTPEEILEQARYDVEHLPSLIRSEKARAREDRCTVESIEVSLANARKYSERLAKARAIIEAAAL